MTTWQPRYDDQTILDLVRYIDDTDGYDVPDDMFDPDSEIYGNLTLKQFGWLWAAIMRCGHRAALRLQREWQSELGAEPPPFAAFFFTGETPNDPSSVVLE